jgi:hypothetical protein
MTLAKTKLGPTQNVVGLQEGAKTITDQFFEDFREALHSEQPVLRIRITLMRNPDKKISFHHDADLESTFHYYVDPDPAPHQSDVKSCFKTFKADGAM